MNEEQQPILASTVPTCYRHPTRETRVSCGRCGKPLCPDCVHHGPVGVRCADCLRPPRVEVSLAEPERAGFAIKFAAIQALLWAAAIATLGWKMGTLAPNLFCSTLAGILVGWTIWRMCGRSGNRKTGLAAWLIGLAIPLLATIGIAIVTPLEYYAGNSLLIFAVRVIVAMGLCGLFAWLLATQRRWERDLFDK